MTFPGMFLMSLRRHEHRWKYSDPLLWYVIKLSNNHPQLDGRFTCPVQVVANRTIPPVCSSTKAYKHCSSADLNCKIKIINPIMHWHVSDVMKHERCVLCYYNALYSVKSSSPVLMLWNQHCCTMRRKTLHLSLNNLSLNENRNVYVLSFESVFPNIDNHSEILEWWQHTLFIIHPIYSG